MSKTRTAASVIFHLCFLSKEKKEDAQVAGKASQAPNVKVSRRPTSMASVIHSHLEPGVCDLPSSKARCQSAHRD